MSHYSINASVPKTLIQFLIRWVADTNQLGEQTNVILRSILETEFSPELIPDDPNGEQPGQRTEDVIGPYELQDFNAYYTARFGYLPSKIAFLAYCAWRNRTLVHGPIFPKANETNTPLGKSSAGYQPSRGGSFKAVNSSKLHP
jgi:NAD+ synthase (glutamine-hydrolysing)